MNAQDRASAWRIRRNNRSRIHTSKLTPWAAGLVIVAGSYVQSGGMAWRALNGGTTAGSAPDDTGGASFIGTDGIQWLHMALLLTQPPTI